MSQGLNDCYSTRRVAEFVAKQEKTKNYLKIDFENITKNPAPQLPQKKPKRGIISSKTEQYLENPDIKNSRQQQPELIGGL